MNYTKINLTDSSRNSDPAHNDLIRYSYEDGMVIEKKYFDPPETEVQATESARRWRNNKLKYTDFIVPLTDYPNYQSWINYRQELRAQT